MALIRFIHSSDWQLGLTRAFLSDEALSRYGQARIDTIAALGAHAQAFGAAFIVVAGDVFESNQVSRQTLARAMDALRALPVPVFLLPGNHDPVDGASIYDTREFREAGEHIVVLDDETPRAVPGLVGVEVVGAPWRSRRPSRDLLAALAQSLPAANGVVRIAVAHGQVDALIPDATRADTIVLAGAEAAIADGRFHYIALGDKHSATPVGDTGRIHYSGTPLVTAFTEPNPNRALAVSLSPEGDCEVEELEVGDWAFIAHQQPLNSMDDVEAFAEWLAALPAKERTAVKVGFVGSVNLSTGAALDALMERQQELFASLRVRERTSDFAVVPDQLDEDSVALSGYAREAWNELLTAARAGDTEAVDALQLCYRLAGQGQ